MFNKIRERQRVKLIKKEMRLTDHILFDYKTGLEFSCSEGVCKHVRDAYEDKYLELYTMLHKGGWPNNGPR